MYRALSLGGAVDLNGIHMILVKCLHFFIDLFHI
jgi:hypothetical protein